MRWLVDGSLAFVLICGIAYLVFNPADKSASPEPVRPGANPPAGASVEPPQLTYITTEDGARKARVDAEALGQWCRSLGLPDPPPLELAEPAVAEALMHALRSAARSPSAAVFGRVGMISESLEAHEAAEQYFQRARVHDPRDFRWPYYIACIQQVTGRSAEAIATFQEVIERNPAYPTTYARLGQLYLEAGRDDRAKAQFQRYAALQPDDSLGYVGLARVALRRGEHQEALRHLTEGVQRGPGNFQCHYYLARTYAALGEKELAQRHFDIAEKLPKGSWFYVRDPLDQQLHATVDSIEAAVREFARLKDSGDWTKLAQLGERIIKQRPRNTTVMRNLAQIYAKQGRFSDAHQMLDRALKVQPEDAELHYIRAQVHFLAKDYDNAIRAADQALQRDAAHAGALNFKGRALYLLGRRSEAIEAVRRSVDADPDNPAVVMLLADMLWEAGMPDQAARYYEKVLQLAPEDETAQARLATIRAQQR